MGEEMFNQLAWKKFRKVAPTIPPSDCSEFTKPICLAPSLFDKAGPIIDEITRKIDEVYPLFIPCPMCENQIMRKGGIGLNAKGSWIDRGHDQELYRMEFTYECEYCGYKQAGVATVMEAEPSGNSG